MCSSRLVLRKNGFESSSCVILRQPISLPKTLPRDNKGRTTVAPPLNSLLSASASAGKTRQTDSPNLLSQGRTTLQREPQFLTHPS